MQDFNYMVMYQKTQIDFILFLKMFLKIPDSFADFLQAVALLLGMAPQVKHC